MSLRAQVQTAEASWRAVLREEILSNAAVLFPDVETQIIVLGPRDRTQALLVAKSSRFLPINVMPSVVLCGGRPAKYTDSYFALSDNLRLMLKKKIDRHNELAKGVEEKILEEFERLTEGVKDKEVAEGVKKALRKEALAEIEKKQREREQEIADGVAAIMAPRKKDSPSTTLGEPESIKMADGLVRKEHEKQEAFKAKRNDLERDLATLNKETNPKLHEEISALIVRCKAHEEEQELSRDFLVKADAFIARQSEIQKILGEKREREATNGAAAIKARWAVELPPTSKPVQAANRAFLRKAEHMALNQDSEPLSCSASAQFAVPDGGHLQSEQIHRAEKKKPHDLEIQTETAPLEPHSKADVPAPGRREWEAEFEKRLYPFILAAVKDAGFSAQRDRLEDSFIAEIQSVKNEMLPELKTLRSEIEAGRKDMLDMFEGNRPRTCTPSTSSGFTEHEEPLYSGSWI